MKMGCERDREYSLHTSTCLQICVVTLTVFARTFAVTPGEIGCVVNGWERMSPMPRGSTF
jgi:hypothetical protein